LFSLILLRFWLLPPWNILLVFKGFDLWTLCCELDYLGLACTIDHVISSEL
jgi:hypothetical protein